MHDLRKLIGLCSTSESRLLDVNIGLYFQPSGIQTKSISEALKMLKDVTPEMKKLGEGAIPYDGGLYPVRAHCLGSIIACLRSLILTSPCPHSGSGSKTISPASKH